MKKIIIALIALLIALGFAIKNCEAKDLTVQNGSIALDEISENNLYIEKIFAMDSEEYKEKRGREAYENLIYDDNGICPMCGREK